MKSTSKHKVSALTKTRVTLPITTALLALIALFGMTACPNNSGGSGAGNSGGGSTLVPPTPGGSQEPKAPLVQGGASLILSPDKLTIRVTVTTSDNSPITVEGCDKTELTSDMQTELKAKSTGVVLKGKITELYCYKNQLTALNVQGLNALKMLNCVENQLTALNVQGLNALKRLECSGNKLTALNVQGLSALYTLHCSDNQLTALNVQGLNALQHLDCYYNQLTALNVQGLNALHTLICGVNKLTVLNVQGLNALKELNCSGNQLTSLNVRGLSALQYLYCGYNRLISLNVQGLNALQRLDCYGNQLTADAFTKLFNDLPQRTVSQDAKCRLYTEQSGVTEGNHKNFTSPGELKAAFDNAKTTKHWKMYKRSNGAEITEL